MEIVQGHTAVSVVRSKQKKRKTASFLKEKDNFHIQISKQFQSLIFLVIYLLQFMCPQYILKKTQDPLGIRKRDRDPIHGDHQFKERNTVSK